MTPGYVAGLPLVFVDTETGGLDPSKNALLSVAAIRCDAKGKPVDRYEAKIKVAEPLTVEAQAAAVNGYTPEKWADGLEEVAVLARLRDLLRDAVWVGHSPRFDQEFIDAGFRRQFLKTAGYKLGYRYLIDTAILSWPILKAGKVEDLKLQTMARHFAIDPGEAHTAMADAESCRLLYAALVGTP